MRSTLIAAGAAALAFGISYAAHLPLADGIIVGLFVGVVVGVVFGNGK